MDTEGCVFVCLIWERKYKQKQDSACLTITPSLLSNNTYPRPPLSHHFITDLSQAPSPPLHTHPRPPLLLLQPPDIVLMKIIWGDNPSSWRQDATNHRLNLPPRSSPGRQLWVGGRKGGGGGGRYGGQGIRSNFGSMDGKQFRAGGGGGSHRAEGIQDMGWGGEEGVRWGGSVGWGRGSGVREVGWGWYGRLGGIEDQPRRNQFGSMVNANKGKWLSVLYQKLIKYLFHES